MRLTPTNDKVQTQLESLIDLNDPTFAQFQSEMLYFGIEENIYQIIEFINENNFSAAITASRALNSHLRQYAKEDKFFHDIFHIEAEKIGFYQWLEALSIKLEALRLKEDRQQKHIKETGFEEKLASPKQQLFSL